MSVPGPVYPSKNETAGALPYVNLSRSPSSSAQPGEIISNTADGRLWLRKKLDLSDPAGGSIGRYNIEQIGGPYVITQKTSGYTLQHQDTGRIIEMNVSSPSLVWIPSFTGASGVNYTVGTEIKILSAGIGKIQITGAAGVTIDTGVGYDIMTQWKMATLLKRDTNSWVITGDIS